MAVTSKMSSLSSKKKEKAKPYIAPSAYNAPMPNAARALPPAPGAYNIIDQALAIPKPPQIKKLDDITDQDMALPPKAAAANWLERN